MTSYPFRLPEPLLSRLPPAAKDGNHYVDIRVKNRGWDGVLVVNAEGMCIGICVSRKAVEFPLPFLPADIEDVRKASLLNRVLSSMPFDLFTVALVIVFLLAPTMLALSVFVLPLFLLSAVIIGCSLAVFFLSIPSGFIFIRPLAIVLGICEVVTAALVLIKHLH
jgi:hypothetical protein